MLQRVANVVLGAMILAVAGCMLLLHLTSGEPMRTLVLLFAGALVVGSAACFRAGIMAGTRTRDTVPALPTAGEEAAWRLRELKRTGATRYCGLRGLSSLTPWRA